MVCNDDVVFCMKVLEYARAHLGSLALPDPLRTGAYRLEIISAVLRGSGTIDN